MPRPPRRLRVGASAALLAILAACQTTPTGPGNVTRIPPGNSERDGPEAHPPPDLDKVPDAVPQIENRRTGGPNKPYEIGGTTYVPMTDDRALTETGLASWYGKKFHGHRTASGEAYNMYAMTAAHKTLPIPSYARVRNPANGKEVIVRVNDRGPFASGRIIDLSYTAALKLGVLNGVTKVEITRITDDDIRSGAAFAKPPTLAANAPAAAAVPPVVQPLPPSVADVVASGAAGTVADAGTGGRPADVDLGAAAAADAASAVPGVVTTTRETVTAVIAPAGAASAGRPDERGRAETAAGAGWWLQLGAFRQRDGALDFQHKLIDEQPWLAPLLAVFTDRGLNKLQAGPYATREEARSAAVRVRSALQLVPTIVEKR